MKKIILIVIFILPVIPFYINGGLSISFGQQTYAQGGPIAGATSGQIFNQSSGGGWYYAGNATGSDVTNNPGCYFVQYSGSYQTYLASNGTFVRNYNLQNEMQGNSNNNSGVGDEDGDFDFGEIEIDEDEGGGGGTEPPDVNPYPTLRLDCAGVQNGTAYLDDCGNCVGGTTNQPPCDCNGDQGGSAYINSCGICVSGNTGQPDLCDSSVIKYYITIGNHPKRYFKGDKIAIQKSSIKSQLIIHLQNGILDPTNCRWTENDSLLTNNREDYYLDVSRERNTTLKVDSANIKPYISNPLIIYNKPIVYFKRYTAYNGEYGFDDYDSTFRHFKDSIRFKAGYEVKKINQDTSYKVPWMSLLHGQNAQIALKKLGIDSAAAHDPNFSIKFSPEFNEIIIRKTPNSTDITNQPIYYNELQTLTSINIFAEQFDGKLNDSLKSIANIYVITNTNDTIGKLHFSCSHATTKKVTYIYVNTGSGYDSSYLSRSTMLSTLNYHSHNQVMRQWEINNTYVDTLNITTAYNLFPSSFKSDSILGSFTGLYKLYTGTDIETIYRNSTSPIGSRNYFYFISDIYIEDSSFDSQHNFLGMSPISGLTVKPIIGNYGALFTGSGNTSTRQTVVHELGHALNLDHTFEPPANIVKYGMKSNFMDYLDFVGPDIQKWFAYYQWLSIY